MSKQIERSSVFSFTNQVPSRPKRGRRSKNSLDTATSSEKRVTETRSPPPPRKSEFDTNSVLGVPIVNFGNFWPKRQTLIDKYEQDQKRLKEEYDYQLEKLYWEFRADSLKLIAEREFNREITLWREGSENLNAEKGTQTEAQSHPESVSQHDVGTDNVAEELSREFQTPEDMVPESPSSTNSEPPHLVILDTRSLPRSIPIPDCKSERRKRYEERRKHRRAWRKEHPHYSYPELNFSESDSTTDTEPLDSDIDDNQSIILID